MSKKIKKIDEFLDIFDIQIDRNEYSEDYIKNRDKNYSLISKENLEKFPKRTEPNFTIEEYREIMLDLEENENLTQEERDELDRDCIEIYGEPFFKKDDK